MKYNYKIHSGDVYFVSKAKAVDGACQKFRNVWADRPAVIISSPEDIDKGGSVLAVFLSKKANDVEWYSGFSPARAVARLRDGARTALCSLVVEVEPEELHTYMEQVTTQELRSITGAVQRGCFRGQSSLNLSALSRLCMQENKDTEPLVG